MISSTTSKQIYNIEGIVTPIASGYEIPFKIFEAEDVAVTIATDDGENTPVTTGWSVKEPTEGTGVYKVVFDEGYTFPEGALKLVISRSIPLEQNVDLRNGDAFDADVLEESLDRQMAVSQQQQEEIDRAFKLPISENPGNIIFPSADERKGMMIGFDDTGYGVKVGRNPDDAIALADELLKTAQSVQDDVTEKYDAVEQKAQEVSENALKVEQIAEDIDLDNINNKFTELEDEIEDVKDSVALPIPEVAYEVSADGFSATLKLNNTFTGYGNVEVRYKFGSEPTATDSLLSVPITASGTYYVRAFPAEGESNQPSPSAIIEISLKLATPAISVQKNTGNATVTITHGDSNATIRYTTDGTEPDEESSIYSSAITVTKNHTVVKAKAFRESWIPSDTATSEKIIIARVWAVKWNYGASSSALARLTPETDPAGDVSETITTEPAPATTSQQGSSPFDAYAPWSDMKKRNFDASGQPSYWEDEEGFSTATYDTMVWIPKFWIKVVDNPTDETRIYYLADAPLDGFTLHPGSGQYVGAYPTSSSKESKSGKARQASQSIVTMRNNAKTKGAGWGLIDIAERFAIQFLYIVEYADWNSQDKIGDGPTSDYSTGYSDVIDYHTGVGTGGVVKYRHIEGLWRSQFEWTDGFNTVNGHHYISTDRDNYQSDVTTGYTDLGSWQISGLYITKLLYDEDMPWLIGIPEEASGGGKTTYVPDYAYLYSSGTTVLSCGGNWNYDSDAGLFYFVASYSSSNPDSYRGSRLSYKEPSAA